MAYGKLKVDQIESSAEELTLPGSVGSAGQVLTTNGSGVLSFVDNATGTNLTATANGTSLTVESSSGSNVALPQATSSAWGVMSDEDKAKLDGVATNANDYSISADLLDEDNMSSDSATKAASQQSIKVFVDNSIAAVIDSAPANLDTLNELAAALGDDNNYAATVTTSLAAKAPKASPAFTGNATCTGSISDSKGNVRTIVQNTQGSTYTLVAGDAGKHILASGTVTIPNSVFSAGDAVTIVNNTGSDLTLTKSITTMYMSSDGTSDNRTLATRGMVTILFASGTVAYISGAGLS